MAYVALADIVPNVVAYIVMANVALADTVPNIVAHIVMAYVVMADGAFCASAGGVVEEMNDAITT